MLQGVNPNTKSYKKWEHLEALIAKQLNSFIF